MILFKIALLNIFRHSTRSLITLAAIIFGCTAIILADGFFNNLFENMREAYTRQHSGHIQVHKRGYSDKGVIRPFDFLIEEPEKALELIKPIAGIQYVTSQLAFAGLISTGETTAPCFVTSIDPVNEFLRKEVVDGQREVVTLASVKMGSGALVEGEALKPEDEFASVIGVGLAANLGVKPGTGLILVANTVSGSMNAIDVAFKGTFRTSTKEFDDRVLRLPLAAAKKLLHTESVQTFKIVLTNIDDTDRVMAEIKEIFEKNKLDYELTHWRDLNTFYFQTRSLFGRFFSVFILVIIIVVILSIFNTMSMAVMERTVEIGTIRAIGNRRQEIILLFLIEGLLLGCLGGLIGIIVGSATTKLVAWIGIPMPPPPGATFHWLSEPELSVRAIATAVLLALVTATLSSIIPAFKASRLEIAEALRHTS